MLKCSRQDDFVARDSQRDVYNRILMKSARRKKFLDYLLSMVNIKFNFYELVNWKLTTTKSEVAWRRDSLVHCCYRSAEEVHTIRLRQKISNSSKPSEELSECLPKCPNRHPKWSEQSNHYFRLKDDCCGSMPDDHP